MVKREKAGSPLFSPLNLVEVHDPYDRRERIPADETVVFKVSIRVVVFKGDRCNTKSSG